MDNNKKPLRVALHGMDSRSQKMMSMYLQGPCKGVAVVVNEESSEADIFDIDSVNGDKLLNAHLSKSLGRPTIVLSLHNQEIENILSVKKPVKIDDMLAALSTAKILISKPNQQTTKAQPQFQPKEQTKIATATSPHFSADKAEEPVAQEPAPPLKKFVLNSDEQKKTSKHQAAMQLNEKGFGAFVGNVPGIDVNDPKQFSKASYDPKEYFQGYVESAYKISQEKGQTRQLNSGWNPLVIFPHNDEVWLDVDETQLRAFSGLAINKTIASKMSVTPTNMDPSSMEQALEKFQSMDAFLWKIACWASKGRYPSSIDIKQPVYLKGWPNFTRLLITPHAMRIAALLVKEPRTLPEIAEVLNIKPQYVFVFISAACSLGLAGQVRREVDTLVQSNQIKPNKNQGLLSRILSSLRGKKA
jgi:hypothetical protein